MDHKRMSADEWREYGKDMIEQGQLAEFHQRRGNWFMYDHHNDQYQHMMRVYHSRKR